MRSLHVHQAAGIIHLAAFHVKDMRGGKTVLTDAQKRFVSLLAFTVLLTASCAGGQSESPGSASPQSTADIREDVAEAFEVFFEPALTGNASAVQPYVSDTCSYKDEFLVRLSEWDELIPDNINLEVPPETLEFELITPTRVKFTLNIQEHPISVNGRELNPEGSSPVADFVFALEEGVWRLANCDDPAILAGPEGI